MSDDNWVGDYMLGQMYGLGGGSGGAWGRNARENDQRLERNKRSYEASRQSTSASTSGAAYFPAAPSAPLTPEERAKRKKDAAACRELDFDENFAVLANIATLILAIYLDVQSGVTMDWWGHLLFVAIPTGAMIFMLSKFPRILRVLRVVCCWALMISMVAAGFWLYSICSTS